MHNNIRKLPHIIDLSLPRNHLIDEALTLMQHRKFITNHWYWEGWIWRTIRQTIWPFRVRHLARPTG